MSTKQYRAITGTLTFETALHVGTGRDHVGTDAPLRRTNAGELFLPGTAIAGALRTLATRLAPKMNFKEECYVLRTEEERKETQEDPCCCAVCHLFGEVNPKADSAKGRASRLWVYDALLLTDTRPFVRDGVGIDRRIGVAARAGQVKFDAEVLPAGASFTLRLELEEANEQNEQLLAAVLAEWEAGRVWMGGNSARGLGLAKLSGVKFFSNDLATGDDLLKFLRAEKPMQSALEDTNWLSQKVQKIRNGLKEAQPQTLPSFIEANFSLKMDGPFLTHDATAAAVIGFNHVPLLDSVPGFDKKTPVPILPGSGLRGALRSHAERIARTLATLEAEKKGQDKSEKENIFLKTCPACNPVEDKKENALTKCDKLVALPPEKEEAEDHHLCLACRLFGTTLRGSRLRVMDARLEGKPQWKPIDFLAIDRFTGGGLEGAKFDAFALWQPSFAARLFLEEPQPWELGWLALLLRDLADGRITFGFGAAKGFGLGKAKDMKIRCGFLQSKVLKTHEREGEPGFYRVAEFAATDWPAYQATVKEWVKAFHVALKNMKRDENSLPPLKKDSYFGEDVYDLYRVKEATHE